MRPQTRAYLLVAVCLILDTVLVASVCEYGKTKDCLNNKMSNVEDVSCSEKIQFQQQVQSCLGLAIADCTEEQKSELNALHDEILQNLDNKCKSTPPTTTTTTTEMPLPECGSQDGWQFANAHIGECREKFKELSKFEYSTKLTKFGVCKNSQDLINCLLADNRLNECQIYKESFYRQIIAHVKFAQLFDCELKIEGRNIRYYQETSGCNLWSWLSCHDSLFSALPGLDPVTEGFDLNKIIHYNVPNITGGLARDRTGCSSYDDVKWSDIAQCRDDMSEKCHLLSSPSRDKLWSAVLSLMYEIKTNIYDKLTTLTNIQDICADGCDDLLNRINKIQTECKSKATGAPQNVIDAFNSGRDTSTNCGKLQEVKTCLKDTVIKNCHFLEQSVVLNLHSDNTWVEAFDICKIELDIQSDGGCTAEGRLASTILDQCSFQTSPTMQRALLNEAYDATVFCSYLQKASDCYAMRISQCPALEREYWVAELPLMAAANQMIAGCHVSYSTYGGTKLLPLDQTTCDMKKWVGCLGSLWTALGISVADNVLSLAGFKEYLALVWVSGARQEQKTRCEKLAPVDFDAINQCVSDLSLECKYPMLTLPDEEDHELELRDPFDIGQLKELVQNICAEECTETDFGTQFKRCIDVSHEANILNTFPEDIIASSYRNHYEYAKCSDLEFTKSCIDRVLDPDKCILLQPGIVHTPSVTEATTLCVIARPKATPAAPINSTAPVTASVLFVVLSAISVILSIP